MKKFKNLFFVSIILFITFLSGFVYADDILETQQKNSSYYTTELKSENTKAIPLEVHYINPDSTVDSMFIRIGNKSIFLDGGYYSEAEKDIAYVKSLGVTQIDYYIGSHAHNDHVGAAGPIIEAFNIKNIICSECVSGEEISLKKEILKRIDENAKEEDKEKLTSAVNACEFKIIKAGEEFYIDDLKIKCIGPVNIKKNTYGKTGDNVNSLILRLDYGGTSFLLPGDATDAEWKDTQKKYKNDLNVTVLKNAHNCSVMSTNIVKTISPKYMVFINKAKYLPKKSYLNTITKLGIEYFINASDKDGTIVATSNGDSVTMKAKDKISKYDIEYNVELNNSSIDLKTGRSKTLEATNIAPISSVIKWTSSNKNVATVDETGKVTGVKEGIAVITARNNIKAEGCLVTVEDPPQTKPVYKYTKTGKVEKEYKDDSINVKIESISKYYVTKIWVEEPSKQVNKKAASWGENLATTNSMLNNVKTAIVGTNGSGFYLSGAWSPRESAIRNTKWNKTTEGYFVMTNGEIKRQIKGHKTNALLGILPNGSLKYYEKEPYTDVINDGVKNTFTFGPLLIKDGAKYRQKVGSPRHSYTGVRANRTSIGQVDENNFIMITTRGSNTSTLDEMANLGIKLNCKLLYNLDGGGSTTLWFRKGINGKTKQVKSSSRRVGDAIYFASGM